MNVYEELKEAIKQYQVRQYDLAYPVFKKYAKLKDAESIYYLGLMTYYGYACKQNMKDAYTLFVKAKEERVVDAFYMLGLMSELGEYTAQDYGEAYQYYQAAFHEGHLEAGIKIAEYYENGYFVEKNPKKAIETYVECAKKDHPYALYKIGKAYLDGIHIKKSVENAHVWLNKALLHGSVEAMNEFRYQGTKSQSDVRTKEQLFAIGKDLLSQNRKNDALIYIDIASREGLTDARHELIHLYQDDINNQGKVKELLEEGAKVNDGYCVYLLGKMYETGQGVASSLLRAEAFYLRANALGYTEAMADLNKIRGDIHEY